MINDKKYDKLTIKAITNKIWLIMKNAVKNIVRFFLLFKASGLRTVLYYRGIFSLSQFIYNAFIKAN